MTNWFLFLDDERNPTDAVWAPSHIYEKYKNDDWHICRDKMSVIQAIFSHDKIAPNFMSFDHDLGENQSTGYEVAKWIVEMDMNGVIQIPSDFTFYVHSKNPVGAKNIQMYLDNYLKLKNEPN